MYKFGVQPGGNGYWFSLTCTFKRCRPSKFSGIIPAGSSGMGGNPRTDTRLLLGMWISLNWEMGINLGRGGDFIPIKLDEISLNFPWLEFRSPDPCWKFSSKIWAKFAGMVLSWCFPWVIRLLSHQFFSSPPTPGLIGQVRKRGGLSWQSWTVRHHVLQWTDRFLPIGPPLLYSELGSFW